MDNQHTAFEQLIMKIRSKLPIQNPLHSFVHNNILMMFEGKEFHEAVSEAGKLYRANPYWPLNKYKERYFTDKISEKDIQDALEHYLPQCGPFLGIEKLGLSSKEFLYYLMFSDLAFNDDEVQPNINEDRLWKLCQEKMRDQSLSIKRAPLRYRAKDYWEKYYNESLSTTTHPFIIRLVSSYLDQGQSFWINPFVNKGFWSFFCFDVQSIKSFGQGWQKILAAKIEAYDKREPQDIIQAELTRMGIPEECWEDYLLEILFDLKGWSGMVNKLEVEPWQATVKAPNIKLVDYIAALVLIESSLDQHHAHLHSTDLSLIYGRQETVELRGFQLSLALYQITKSFKLEEDWMLKHSSADLVGLVEMIDQAEKTHLIRLWHEAYEHHFYREALSAIVPHQKTKTQVSRPRAQVLFCIDDREESIRRHLEEVAPDLKTFGVVGFFGIDMKFASVKNQRLIAQCPPVVNPSRVVREIPRNEENAKGFLKFNELRGGSDLSLYYHSRTLFRGLLSTLILGSASIVPMFLQVFFPKQSKLMRQKIFSLISPEPVTEIDLEKGEANHGYTKGEMAGIVEIILRMCGFKDTFAPLVILAGHGSTSNNNPFKQAYGCGACGGNAGIPNSRSFAKMANDPQVREELKKVGIVIPEETYFVSGFHDTCTDEFHFFDTQLIPQRLLGDFERVKVNLSQAAQLNAFERCQRFSSFEATGSPEEAVKHVKERAEDLAQPRPEYGHSTNALAVVGKRELTQGLFLNRRSFLITYDWETDPEGKVLAQVILGSIPVCVNINMDYYFSSVDNDNFGCGSKLPLNLTSLLGVMTGSQSDLRIGLARQMVEIHEPIRNMTIVEAPLLRVKKIFDGHPRLKNILYHHWMRLVVNDPETNSWHIFAQNDFKPLIIEKASLKHFRSSMDLINKVHVEEDFAEIDQ